MARHTGQAVEEGGHPHQQKTYLGLESTSRIIRYHRGLRNG